LNYVYDVTVLVKTAQSMSNEGHSESRYWPTDLPPFCYLPIQWRGEIRKVSQCVMNCLHSVWL